ncbi:MULTISPECIES: MtrAB system histidine kinase MtrB [unclassified Modestobacter]|uniref:MtrAB system histidine kinase MtrB n=1 Tax=unclassified Modestobacter TaxID=2643866 RepID=UPI0022AAB826|nr:MULTISPECIES: MtrAB system histidine kinase MtrB [unclassified Modestobacter]MCZ2823811.1 MtrAB system histidine kinase MtrB [Modestobacter sp. VKM Ac-2981]MCZ2852056.1 MtrAB system histidine kinase MtrB [Modestobacter sp. VKM Ac-2982]
MSTPPVVSTPTGEPAADRAGVAAPGSAAAGAPGSRPARRPPSARVRRRVRRTRRRAVVVGGRALRRALHAWRSSLQVRIGAITMLVASTVVVIVSLVLFSQISDQLLRVKRDAAIDQALNGVAYAQTEVSGIATGDSASVRSTLARTVTGLTSRGGAAGDFDVVMVYGSGDQERPAWSRLEIYPALPADLRAEVADGSPAYRYAEVPGAQGEPVPTLVVGAPVPTDARSGDRVEVYFAFPLDQEQESLGLIRSTVVISGTALVLFVVGIGVLVTRLVVGPVRRAAGGAQRLAAGHLEERLAVRGEDDLARLATSFNAMAESLQKQITQLEALSHLQQRFTSDVSHELRTPLTTVQMAADVLHEARADFDPAVARSAELLRAELDRFEGLLTDLLEISRYDAGAATLEAEAQDLGPLVERVAAGMTVLAERHGCTLEVDVPASAVIAEVDGRRVERVLRNLIGNAIEHGQGQPVEITLAANRSATAITVRDHGVGLDPVAAQHVFDRFWRADPSRMRTVGGSGLGLSISLEDARLHGGWLQVWGQPGQGAQFRLTLPLTAGADLASSPLPLRPAPTRLVGGAS